MTLVKVNASLKAGQNKKSSLYEAKKEKQVVVVGKTLIRSLIHNTNSAVAKPKNVIVLSNTDLARIKNEAKGVVPQDANAKQNELKQKELERLAKERKERIIALDQAKISTQAADVKEVTAEQSKAILARAKRIQDEQEDEIKRMNQYIAEARAMTVREAQIKEKQIITEAEKKEQMRLDAIMEHNRVKGIQETHVREKLRKDQIRQGANIVKQQILERKEAELLELEKKEQETRHMLEELEKRNKEDHEKRIKEEQSKRELLNEISKANSETIERKKEYKIHSREEDIKIVKYLLDKAAKEEEKEKLEKQRRVQKEIEYAKLRALQERLGDSKAEQDALRAKRAAEEHEREWRRKEKEVAEKKAKQERDLKETREKQKKFKEQVITVEALKTRQEFQAMLQRQKQSEDKIAQEKKHKEEHNRKFLIGLREQIESIEGSREKAKETFLTEGRKFQQRQMEHKKHIEDIKSRKFAELRGMGISEKQCNEIMRKMAYLDTQKLSSQPYFYATSKKAETSADE